MNFRIPKLTLSVLALSIVLWGCDRSGHTSAESLLEPHGGGSLSVTTTDGVKYTIAKGKLDSKTDQDRKEISSKGGQLETAGHRLIVPKDAVGVPTLFTLTAIPVDDSGSRYVMVELRAYERDADGQWTVDVGPRGFAVPVQLEMTYSWMTDKVGADQLKLLWVKPDKTGEVQATTVDTVGYRVISKLSHFSDYGVGYP